MITRILSKFFGEKDAKHLYRLYVEEPHRIMQSYLSLLDADYLKKLMRAQELRVKLWELQQNAEDSFNIEHMQGQIIPIPLISININSDKYGLFDALKNLITKHKTVFSKGIITIERPVTNKLLEDKGKEIETDDNRLLEIRKEEFRSFLDKELENLSDPSGLTYSKEMFVYIKNLRGIRRYIDKIDSIKILKELNLLSFHYLDIISEEQAKLNEYTFYLRFYLNEKISDFQKERREKGILGRSFKEQKFLEIYNDSWNKKNRDITWNYIEGTLNMLRDYAKIQRSKGIKGRVLRFFHYRTDSSKRLNKYFTKDNKLRKFSK
jgi:hypothetical protein